MGQNLRKEFICNLMDCNELWVLVSPTSQSIRLNQEMCNIKRGSIERPYVWLETGAAWYRKIPIVPLLQNISISDLRKDEDIPLVIKSRRCVELSNPHQCKELLESVREKVTKHQQDHRTSERLPISPPIIVKFENGGKCSTAQIIERSVDGFGYFLGTKDSVHVNSVIKLSFNASVRHRNPRQHNKQKVKGIGVRVLA